MKKKTAKLTVVENQQSAADVKEEKTKEEDEADELSKLSRAEIRSRVHSIRQELEYMQAHFDGAIFDAMTNDGPPHSLYTDKAIREHYQLTDYLNPMLRAQYDRVMDRVGENPLLTLHSDIIQTAYQIGMLAGAIFADCPAAIIDRFERGLAFATGARSWQVKKESKTRS
jgi:hypothetical protein